jgi:hypothetical protein
MYNVEIKIDERDKDFAVIKVTDENGNYGSWMAEKHDETYYIATFMTGKINGKVQFDKAPERGCERIIKACGRGRKSKEAWDIIKNLEKEAYKNYSEW